MKRFILSFIFSIGIAFTVNAQTQQTHIVQRGETLSSIAKKYGVTEAQIKKLNPDTEDYFYVGMKVVIPEKQNDNVVHSEETVQKVETATNVYTTPVPSNTYMEINNSNDEWQPFHIGLFGGLSLNNWSGKDAKDCKISSGFHVGMSLDYFFVKNAFAELCVGYATKGYKKDLNDSSGNVWDEDGANYDIEGTEKMTTHNFDIALLLGGSLDVTEDVSFRIKAGPYMTNALSGEKRIKYSLTEYEDIHSSSTERIDKKTKLKDIKDYQKVGYGFLGGVGICSNHLSLWINYQRSISKLVKKKKIYEENILITVGVNL